MIWLVLVLVATPFFMAKSIKILSPLVGSFTVSSKYGNRVHPVTGKETFHNGIDIPLPVGTDLRAMYNGKIADIYENTQGGIQMLIDYDNGFRSGFAHLSETLVKKGETVKKGQIVARSGNTGQSTGPHLHLTLRKNGELVNPENYV